LLREYQDQVIGRSILDVSIIGEESLAQKNIIILKAAWLDHVNLTVLHSSVYTTIWVVDIAVLGQANGFKDGSFNELFL